MTDNPANGDTPVTNLDNVWVKLDTLKDAAIEEVNEDSDLILVVGDIDVKPKHQFKIKQLVKQGQNEQTKSKTSNKRIITKYKYQHRYMYCDHCNFKTVSRGNLILHIRRKHMMTEPVHCSFCPFSTKSLSYLSRHIAQQHKTFECSECPYKTIYKRNFADHKREHLTSKHGIKKYKKLLTSKTKKIISKSYLCSKCPFISTQKVVLKTHLANVHGEIFEIEKYVCEYCNYITERRRAMQLHTDSSLQDNLIKCKECDFESWYMCEYRQHKKSHPRQKIFGNGEAKIFVNKNNTGVILADQKYPRKPDSKLKYDKSKKFLINTELQLDRKKIPVKILPGKDANERMFQCTQCLYISKRKEFLMVHFQKHHTNSTTKPYLCINCDFAAKYKGHIRKHNKINRSSELLHCKSCSFTAQVKCLLEMHERLHKAFHCVHCNHTYNTIYHLNKHYDEMHVNQEYKCELCAFTTFKIREMIQHRSRHTGINPWKCSQCDFSSKNESTVIMHLEKCH